MDSSLDVDSPVFPTRARAAPGGPFRASLLLRPAHIHGPPSNVSGAHWRDAVPSAATAICDPLEE